MALPQAVVVALLASWSHELAATLVAASLLLQLVLMRRLLRRPKELAPWYNATGVSLFVIGMLISALALRAGSMG
jgi:chlorophyll synthase